MASAQLQIQIDQIKILLSKRLMALLESEVSKISKPVLWECGSVVTSRRADSLARPEATLLSSLPMLFAASSLPPSFLEISLYRLSKSKQTCPTELPKLTLTGC